MDLDHLDSRLADFLLGELPLAELGRWQGHVTSCERCGQLLSRVEDALADLSPVAAPPEVLERVLTVVAHGFERFRPLLGEVARFLDLDQGSAAEVLRQIDDPQGWTEGFPGVVSRPTVAGPRWTGAQVCLFKLAAGAHYPDHTHEGTERVLVVQGGYRCDCGNEVWRGDQAVGAPGTRHAVVALEGVDCVCVAIQEPR